MKKLILLLCILNLSACMQAVHFTNATLSTRDINVSHVNLNKMPKTKNVIGESSCYYILGLIPTCGTYSFAAQGIDEAVNDALIKGNGDIITDAQVKIQMLNYILFAEAKSTVEGTVVKLQGGK